ncbi:MAG: DUF3738 domain-containing protein [Terriglobales bacterium]
MCARARPARNTIAAICSRPRLRCDTRNTNDFQANGGPFIVARDATFAAWAGSLSYYLRVPVEDRTDAKGKFDIDLNVQFPDAPDAADQAGFD